MDLIGGKGMLDEFNIIKRKKKKNAFVSTALLITIGIAILVIILVVLLLGKKNNNKCESNTCSSNGNTAVTCSNLSKEDRFKENLRTIKDAAVSYFTVERMPTKVGEKRKLTLTEVDNKFDMAERLMTKGCLDDAERNLIECADIGNAAEKRHYRNDSIKPSATYQPID